MVDFFLMNIRRRSYVLGTMFVLGAFASLAKTSPARESETTGPEHHMYYSKPRIYPIISRLMKGVCLESGPFRKIAQIVVVR